MEVVMSFRRDNDGVPYCTETSCPQYDGKRCKKLGYEPGVICQPVVVEMAKRLAALESKIDRLGKWVAVGGWPRDWINGLRDAYELMTLKGSL